MCQQKYKKNYGVVQHYLLGDSIVHCKCANGVLYWLHFNAGILIFLYSFRRVGAMQIVVMDMKVRSIVF